MRRFRSSQLPPHKVIKSEALGLMAWLQVRFPPLSHWVILSTFLPLSVPLFPYLYHEGYIHTYHIKLLWNFIEMNYVNCLEKYLPYSTYAWEVLGEFVHCMICNLSCFSVGVPLPELSCSVFCEKLESRVSLGSIYRWEHWALQRLKNMPQIVKLRSRDILLKPEPVMNPPCVLELMLGKRGFMDSSRIR